MACSRSAVSCTEKSNVSCYPVWGFGIPRACMFLLWFYVGYWFERHRVRLNAVIIKRMGWPAIFAASLAYAAALKFLWSVPDLSEASRNHLLFLAAAAGVAITYCVCLRLSLRPAAGLDSTVSFLSKYSYEMYLYSDPLNYILIGSVAYFSLEHLFASQLTWAAMIAFRILIAMLAPLLIALALKPAAARSHSSLLAPRSSLLITSSLVPLKLAFYEQQNT